MGRALGFAAALLAVALPRQAPAFPAPQSAGAALAPEAVEPLVKLLEARVAAGELPGAELLVVHRGRTVLHRTFGDRGDGEALAPGALHSAGALAGPLLGTLAQIAIDRGLLGLDDPAAATLPGWEGATPVPTLRHLLTRQSGLGAAPPAADLRAAAEALARGTDRGAPGRTHAESHADLVLLAALLEAAFERPLPGLLEELVLAPAGMGSTRVGTGASGAMDERRLPLRRRGERGWEPAERPEAAPAVATTAEDAARLLALWLDKGRAGGKRVLSRAAVARALDPAVETVLESGLPGLELRGGQMWRLHVAGGSGAGVEGFSAAGTDGSFLWAWPEREIGVVLLSSSRGIDLRAALEAAMAPLLPPAFSDASLAEPLAGLTGLFWDTEGEEYVAVLESRESLLLEVPGVFVLPLRRARTGWKIAGAPWDVEFQRDAGGGADAVVLQGPEQRRRFERRPPAADLPPVAQVMDKKLAASGWSRLPALGTWRRVAAVERSGSAGRGTVTSWIQGGRARVDVELGAARQSTWLHGPRAWQKLGDGPAQELDPPRAEQTALEHPAVLLSDWRLVFQDVEVLRRGTAGGQPVLVVRAVPLLSPAVTYTLSETTWQVLRIQRIVWLPGFGNVGIDVALGDYRTVEGVTLPFRSVTSYALPDLGRTTVQVLSIEPRLEAPEGLFTPPEK